MQALCNYYHFDIKGENLLQNDHLHGLLILYLKGTRISIFCLFGMHMDFFFGTESVLPYFDGFPPSLKVSEITERGQNFNFFIFHPILMQFFAILFRKGLS